MALEWWTYEAGGAQLGISGTAFRHMARKASWPGRNDNGVKREVWVDIEEVKAAMPPHRQRRKPGGQPSDARTFEALHAHIETLTGMWPGSRRIANASANEQTKGGTELMGLRTTYVAYRLRQLLAKKTTQPPLR